ncbi:16S rRNA (adenine(1518)-N(6)/adenine(1519)-N(6))-dimethyltransferase RsmA [Nitrosomonas sp.]|uniref:16S rRNA (adenine(1518)-N(6)/adenine(1519)-N(6))- dimethyltransferase RsmA n=1 Tax=Nitrosomonas sp. TaxID=42353 RepID=UPI001D828270|nr:16S rRNA (adenine(1518)-N(6)/adenine(1519)-N(6))-dimethyltransferase RsmA [Nitrosomonas sp.]MBX3616137.1 16S rRNA (adenine(1518)-N(6)/adenine(1519)-N(6))-dimethyltransferase RsmA [Nitrosomonas sp.]
MRHKARKRFGQNFLIDQSIIAKIIAEIHPQKNDRIIEIGPGLGALTKSLIRMVDHLDVIEIDRDIAARLHDEFARDKLTIYTSDALRFDFASLGNNLRIVGNLPYNISTPLLFHLSQFKEHVFDMHFMLQKEVVERMVGAPDSSNYGRLSVMLQYRFDMEYILDVPPESFSPMPKVESAVVRMTPKTKFIIKAANEDLFSQIVSAAFSLRRKTLRNALYHYLKAEDFIALEIDSRARAENLPLEKFVAITNYLSHKD